MSTIELIHGDCLQYLKTLPDDAFDLAIVDPPYGIGMSGGRIGGDNKSSTQNYKHFAGHDLSAPGSDYFSELKRVSVHQIIWGANHFCGVFNSSSPSWIVWDKQNGGSTFADCELAYTSHDSAVRRFTFRWAGMLQGNMAQKETRIHPTQKPVVLYEWLLMNYAKPGDRILDTHLGSGSSAIAAWNHGHDFVGIELDADYYAAAKARLEAHQAQPRMALEMDIPDPEQGSLLETDG